MVLELEYPGPPVSWARARRKGPGYYTPEKQREHRKALSMALWAEHRRNNPVGVFEGPLELGVMFDYSGEGLTVVRLKGLKGQRIARIMSSHRGRPRKDRFKVTRPDLDNLVKQVMEALEDSGLIEDDKQIAQLWAEKIK